MKNDNKNGKVAVVKGLVVVATVKQFRETAGVRTAVMLDLNGQNWGRMHVSEAGSLDRTKRDEMLAGMNVGDKVEVKVLSVEENGRRPKVEVSAKALLLEKKETERAARATEQQAARGELIKGKLLKGKVTRLQPFGAFVSLDAFHTGLLHNDEQLPPSVRAEDLKVGDIVECLIIREVTGTGRDMKISLSEKGAVASRVQQAKDEAAGALLDSLVVGQQYPAETVGDLGKDVGLMVEINGLLPATLPNGGLLDITKRASSAGKGQHLTVEVVSIDDCEVVVKQVKKVRVKPERKVAVVEAVVAETVVTDAPVVEMVVTETAVVETPAS